MLSSTNNNVDTGKWQEIVLDEIQSDIENYSDNELPISSIVTSNNIDTEKWQNIIMDSIQSNMESDSENECPLSSISTVNDGYRIARHQEINLDDIQSDIENYSDNELPLSSIANVMLPIKSCNNVKFESVGFLSKIDNHNTSDSSQISIREQCKIDIPMKNYECGICGKIFLRRIAIIEHFRTSLCFPQSSIDFEHNSPTYYFCNDSNNMKDMTYKCIICQDVIRYDNFIKRRQILHTKEKNFCNICSVLNSIACENNHHLKEKYTWKCKTCGRSFTNLSVLKAHRCIFPKNKLFNCHKCYKSYKNLNALVKHKMTHKLNCDICSKQFFKQSSLTEHKRIHYLKNVSILYNIPLNILNSNVLKHTRKIINESQNYECSRCSKVFHKRSEIVSHIFENHQVEYSKYSCDECTNVCDSTQDYILRLEKNCFKCDVCPESFTTSHRLQQHYGWHLGINYFKCQFCPQTFSKYSLYLSHERTHTGERPLRCNFCGKWFPESSNLNIHLKPYKLFVCNICEKSYTQMSSLLFHKKIHAKEKRSENRSCNELSTLEVRTRRQYTRRKQFKCKLCAKSFFCLWSLNAHLKTHLSKTKVKKSSLNKYKKPQENDICIRCNSCQEIFCDKNILITHRCKSSTCTCCLKVFNNVSSLKSHYRHMHQKNKKLFDCDICKISFMCSTSLNEHRKNHTQFEKSMPLKFNVSNEINTVNEHKCDICMKSFINQKQIFAHILETHY